MIDTTKLKHPERFAYRHPANAQSKVYGRCGYSLAKFADGWRVTIFAQGWENPFVTLKTKAEALEWASVHHRKPTTKEKTNARLERMAEELRANGYIVEKR